MNRSENNIKNRFHSWIIKRIENEVAEVSEDKID